MRRSTMSSTDTAGRGAGISSSMMEFGRRETRRHALRSALPEPLLRDAQLPADELFGLHAVKPAAELRQTSSSSHSLGSLRSSLRHC